MCPIATQLQCIDAAFDNAAIRYRCWVSKYANLSDHEDVILMPIQNLTAQGALSHVDFMCTLTMFYVSNCPFSAKLAPYFNAVPKRFRRIRALAVDSSEFSKYSVFLCIILRFNTRYGIAGTPTVLLWVDGVATARMDERNLSAEGLASFLADWTDLEPVPGAPTELPDGPLVIPIVSNIKYGLVNFCLTWTVFLLCIAYYIRKHNLVDVLYAIHFGDAEAVDE